MTIDLKRFTESKEVVIPLVKNWGKYRARKVQVPNIKDGWYKVLLFHRNKIMREATPLEIDKVLKKKKKIKGYTLGNEIVPFNFENLKRRGEGETVEVNFLDQPAWEIVNIVKWDDNRYYYAGLDFNSDRVVFNLVARKFEAEGTLIGIKGVTPEIRYYWLLLSLQRQSLREFKEIEKLNLSRKEREKRIKEFQNTFSGRLKTIIESAGGKLVRFYKQGQNRYLVHWKTGEQLVKTIINDRMQIYSLGFCASGMDRVHSMSSAVILACTFQEESPLYITRE